MRTNLTNPKLLIGIFFRRENRRKSSDEDASEISGGIAEPEIELHSLSESEIPYTTSHPWIPDVIPKRFDYKADWWQRLSYWYRDQKGWQCEECNISLYKHYLHTHHIYGTQWNKPRYLKALCIGCHSEQPWGGH